MNLKLIRELVKLFKKDEEAVVDNLYEKEVRPENFIEFGFVDVVIKDQKIFIPLIRLIKSPSVAPAQIVKMTSGIILIVFEDNFLTRLMNHNNGRLLASVIAHEVGHLLGGHFSEERSKEGMPLIGVRKKQERFSKLYNETEREYYYDRSMAADFIAIIRGDIFKKELEADLIALEFVEKRDLIEMHLFVMAYVEKCSMGTHSRWVSFEKISRMKFIAMSVEEKYNSNGSKLEITLSDNEQMKTT